MVMGRFCQEERGVTYLLVMLAVVLIGHVCRRSPREYDGTL